MSPLPSAHGTVPPNLALDLHADVVELTAVLCDIESVSGDEAAIADAIEGALRPLGHLRVERIGNTVIARTDLGRGERVVLAGHIDTVPLTGDPNLPTRRVQDGGEAMLWGRGTVDMKGGVAVQLKLASALAAPNRDITFLFYDCEEVDSARNGLAKVAASHPELLEADFAVLLEPTNGAIEGGCKGSMRVDVTVHGKAAHSARPWNGRNAIHDAREVLNRLAAYEPATVHVDGLDYHEALNAVGIKGGIAGNVIPDKVVIEVNYRYAPDKDTAAALAHVGEVLAGYDLVLVDAADGARPGLQLPAAQAFVAALGLPVGPKEGWTDVARFSALGIPAVNFGPGDPNFAHADGEQCPVAQILESEAAMLRWLS